MNITKQIKQEFHSTMEEERKERKKEIDRITKEKDEIIKYISDEKIKES